MSFKTLVNQTFDDSVLSDAIPNARQLIDGLKAQIDNPRLYDLLVLLNNRVDQLVLKILSMESTLSILNLTVASLFDSVATFDVEGNKNDFNALAYTIIRFNSTTGANIRGIVAQQDGARKTITNVSSALTVTLTHESGTSAAENRLKCQGSASITLNPGFSANMWYDAVQRRWLTYPE